MSDTENEDIAEMEAARAQESAREHVLAAEHLAAVEAFISDYGVESLDIALAAGPLFRRLRQESRWALETAISASRTRGVDGYLVVRLPRMPTDLTEMSYVSGGAELTLNLGG